MKVVHTKYTARGPFKGFHTRKQRFALMVCHRRAGKTTAVINDLVVRALRTKKQHARYGYLGPTYKQTKLVVWAALKRIVTPIKDAYPEGAVKIREHELSVELPNGATISLYGVDKPDSLRGAYFDGVACDEFGEWEGRAWSEVIRPALADRKGWAVFIGTPKGKNKFYQMRQTALKYPQRWFYLEVKASTSGLLPQVELDDMKRDMEPEEYEQELECNFEVAHRGQIYGDVIQLVQSRGQFVDRDLYDPTQRVHCAHDLGHRDAWCIWFWQYVDGAIHIIDYWEQTGYDAQQVMEVLELRYPNYGFMYLPHDAFHRTAASGKSVQDQFRDKGFKAKAVPNPDGGSGVHHGISAARTVLRTYPLVFNVDRCEDGIEALKGYSRVWNAEFGVFSDKPKHDQYSHGADAFRYMSLSLSVSEIQRSIGKSKEHLAKPVNIGD